MKQIQKIAIFFIILTLASLAIFYDPNRGYSWFVIILTSIHFLVGVLLIFNLKVGRVILEIYIKPLYIGVPSIYVAKYIQKVLDEENSIHKD